MGTILKVTRDPAEDRYVIWSDIVEAPAFQGTLAETRRYLTRSGESDSADRFERADKTGTSSHLGIGGWDQSMIYEQRGLLPREKLGELLDALTSTPPAPDAAWDLLEPFEDETEVRRG